MLGVPPSREARLGGREEAAKAALDLGVPTYRFLRLPRTSPPLTLRQVDRLILQSALSRSSLATEIPNDTSTRTRVPQAVAVGMAASSKPGCAIPYRENGADRLVSSLVADGSCAAKITP